MNNHLIPEQRVDKNGVTSIKHVRPNKPELMSYRNLPLPTIAAMPVPNELILPDYDAVIEQNKAFLFRSEPVLMTPTDLVAYTDLLDYAF